MKHAVARPEAIRFTKEGYRKMEADFGRLTKEREEVLVRLQTAREMGDLSENGAYHAAKFELGSIDRRLRRLSYRLRFGVVIQPVHAGIADFGSTITLKFGDKRMTFTLVNGYESDPKQNKLSVTSPLGRAVLGKKVGDTVTFLAPAGRMAYTVEAVE